MHFFPVDYARVSARGGIILKISPPRNLVLELSRLPSAIETGALIYIKTEN